MARRTVRVEIPTSKPEDFSKLLNEISKKHTALGAASPLATDPDIDMAVFASSLGVADGFRQDSENFRRDAENSMQKARQKYGTDKGQGIDTPGTLLFTLDLIKKQLLKKFKNNEEALSTWGFKVVVGQAKSPTKKPTK